MPNTSMIQEFVLTLSHNEALVLFDFLGRFNEQKQLPDSAEQQILYNVKAILGRQLPEVFSSDYNNLVNSAKHLLLKSNDQYSGHFLKRDAIAIQQRSEKSECNLNQK